jgi:hypothetical protein
MMLKDSSQLIFGEAVRPQLATIERVELVGTSTSKSRRPANRLRTRGNAPSKPDTRPPPKAPKKLKWEVWCGTPTRHPVKLETVSSAHDQLVQTMSTPSSPPDLTSSPVATTARPTSNYTAPVG